MTTLVLLPGMDGTGDLFAPFLAVIRPQMDVQVIRYTEEGPSSYEALVEVVRAQLPTSGDFILLGESFSGPIAVALAATKPTGLIGLILCCTFIRNPRTVFGGLQSLLGRLPAIRPPMAPLAWVLMGGYSTPELLSAFRAALSKVSAQTLRARLQAVLGIDVTAAFHAVKVPMLYLRASKDRSVPAEASALMKALRPDLQVEVLEGPHFLLQANPKAARDAVARFVAHVVR